MPSDFVIFWRDLSTEKTIGIYDTLDKLIAAKPLQVLVFDDNNSMVDNHE